MCIQIGMRKKQQGEEVGGLVTQALIMPGELQQSHKDCTRPPPCSNQDIATEGCSAVWGRSNKLLPQSGPAEAFHSAYSLSELWQPLLQQIYPVFACVDESMVDLCQPS